MRHPAEAQRQQIYNYEGPWANYGDIPYDLDPTDIPPTYVEVIERPREYPPVFLTAPDNQFNDLLKENIVYEGLPEPIRESEFWASGEKIKPDARMWISSHVGLGTWQNWENPENHIGKLIGYLLAKMYQGHQLPSVLRANIQEAYPTTYGSLYEVSPMVPAAGPAFTASGFDLTGFDGDPYH